MSTRLATLGIVLVAAVTAPLVVSAAGVPAPAAKVAQPAPVAVAAIAAPAPVVTPAPVAALPAADCGRKVRVVYQGYAPAPVACTASR